MPRMTNTFMLGGQDDPAELVTRVKDGIFAKSFGGGQVDITSGKFVFSCTEAYRIQDGKLGAPIKGATLIGDGPSVLTRVKGIGNDMALDEGVGLCGKGGQTIPAGVGQPTLLIDGLTVGRHCCMSLVEIGRYRVSRWSKRISPGSRLAAMASRPFLLDAQMNNFYGGLAMPVRLVVDRR